MVAKSAIQSFTTGWNQTAAWAQSKGLKYNQYFPVYQLDSQRLALYGGSGVMSQAERERAILAAANPGQAQQSTPSTAGNPGNVVGNTMNDLRNIFTGIGDIAIHPLNNGLVDSIKNTFDLIDGSHHLTGKNDLEKLGDALTSTVLSWVPGASDVGTVLSAGGLGAGLADLAEHPVSSILDVLPIAKPLAFASDADTAARVGMTLEQANKATVGRVLKGYIMNTETSKIGRAGPMTVGDRWEAMKGASFLGSNKEIGDAALTMDQTESHFTTEERMIWADAENSTKDLTNDGPDSQMEQLHQIFDPASKVPLDQRIDEAKDPLVQQAARDLRDGPLRFHREQVLAARDITILTDPKTGYARIYSTTDHADVITKRDDYITATKTLMDKMPGMEKLAQRTNQAEQLIKGHSQALEMARTQARDVDVGQGNFAKTLPGMKRATGISMKSISEKMFGDGGFISEIVGAVGEGRFEDAEEMARSARSRLQKWEVRSVDATSQDAPAEFKAVLAQVDALQVSLKEALKVRKETELKIYGKGVRQLSDKGHRDALAKQEREALERKHTDQRGELRQETSRQRGRIRAAFVQKVKEIRTRYNWDIAEQRAQIKAATEDINNQFELQKANATTAHLAARETHQAWIAGKRAEGMSIPRDYIGQQEMGVHIHEGQPGSKSAELKDHAMIEARKREAIKTMVDSFPKEETLLAKMQVEIRDADLAERAMLKKLDQQFQKSSSELGQKQKESRKAFDAYQEGKRARDGEWSKAYREWNDARKKFSQAVWHHPPDVFNDIYFNALAKRLMENESSQHLLAKTETMLADKHDWGQDKIDELRKNGKVLAELVQLAVKDSFDHPVFTEVDQEIVEAAAASAKQEVRRLMDEGFEPQYIPHISSTQIRAEQTGSYGIHLVVGRGIPKLDAASARTWGLDQSRFDLMAAAHHGIKQVLTRDAVIEYADKFLSPRVVNEKDLLDKVTQFYGFKMPGLKGQAVLDFVNATAKEWGLVEFDPQAMIGFKMPRWGQGKLYLDGNLAKALDKMTKQDFPIGTYDKITRLFRFSILGLSPRYTAHILFGGTFLLALRSSPYMLKFLGDAHRMVKEGQDPEGMFSAPATNMGTTEYALRQLHHEGGKNIGHLLGQEELAKQGIDWQKANPLQWLKALGDLNLRLTNHIVHMQRAVAYLDGAAKGERMGMTAERAAYEGMHHAEQVMGDLRRMSPFERTVARTVVPFYGWEKHILQYVLSFPADHPWRAMMLSQMAEYDTSHEAAGLPSRYQFLFFLGTPDAQGNVSVLDFRSMNPLRDVANYATLGGLISSLNPIVTSAFAMVDPSIIYGSNQLYPNLTYDQFYGIETAPAQGNLLTAVEGVVPQVGALTSAIKLASAARGANSASALKSIYENLNIPMFQVQHINLRQEAAKTALARYQVTKSLAATAWQTGNFQPISDLGSVPDPRNADYETPVSQLEQLYAELQKEYPGQNPADVSQGLPTVHL